MNDERAFERYVADNVAAEAGGTPLPDDFYDDLREYTDSHRQPPRWLALIKEPPMRTNSQLAVGSPTVRVVAIMAATILLAVALAAAGIAGQQLLAADGAIIVARDGSGDHESIQEAVDSAADGDTIHVRPGTYDESVFVAKDVNIRGDGERENIVIANSEEMGPTVQVDTPDLPVAFRIMESNPVIENLTLRGESSRVEIHGGSPTLDRIHFDDIGRIYGVDPGNRSVPAGVDVLRGSTASITDSEFTGATLLIRWGSSPQIVGNDLDTGAIFVDGVDTNPLIEGNTITAAGSFHAVTAWGGAKPTIRGNTISSQQDGINVRDTGFPSSDRGPWPTIEENTIRDSRTGISVDGGEAGANIVGNTLMDNRVGIVVGSSDTIIEGNTVSGGVTGIILAGGAPSLTDNTVEGAEKGLSVGAGTTLALQGNTLCGNATNLVVNELAEPPETSGNEICEDAAGE